MLYLILLTGLALAFLFTYVVLSIRDLRVPRLAFYTMLAGVLIANKGFATIGLGPLFIMDGLVGLSLLGVLVNRTGRTRLIRSRIAWLVLAGFLIVGCVALARGRAHGLNAVMDSVINFYALAALVPIALFPDARAVRSFACSLGVPAAIGAALFLSLQAMTQTSLGERLFTGSAATNATAGLILVVALWRRISLRRLTVVILLAGAMLLGFARADWLGFTVAGTILLIASGKGRKHFMRMAIVGAWLAASAFVYMVAVRAPLANRVVGEVQSFFFKESSATRDDPVANSAWRLTAWSETWDRRIRPNIVFGEGFGRPALDGTTILIEDPAIRDDPRVQVHNGYLTFLLREGVVGLSLFLAFVLLPLRRCIVAARRLPEPEDRLLAMGIAGAILVYLVDIGFGVVIEGPMTALPFWSLVGAGYAAAAYVPLTHPSRHRIPAGTKERRRAEPAFR